MGLSEKELDMIRAILEKHGSVSSATLFGSRAKGTFQNHSDIDLAISGRLSSLALEAISHELNELPLPFKFDIVGFESITSKDLLEHIGRVGIRIYP